jgi:hypothetical protein
MVGTVAIELRLQVADLLRQLLLLGVARREFLLELLLGALGRCRFAEQALGVDEADLVVGAVRHARDQQER